MFGTVTGVYGRLVAGYDVLTEFHGWVATAHYSGSQDAVDRRPGGRLSVTAHQPDELYWPPGEDETLKVELDIGRTVYVSAAQILTEAPLTIEILGPLDPQ
jgi:hypothetical protein